jgi:hypothetical protein
MEPFIRVEVLPWAIVVLLVLVVAALASHRPR